MRLYPLQDLLYRTTALCDSGGVLREAYDFDAYGNTLIYRNAPTSGGQPPAPIDWTDTQVNYPTCDFLFTGQRYDAESEIYCYKLRYYAPALGRFVGRDPMHLGGSSAFDYTQSAPAKWFDPLGLFTWSADTKTCKLVLTAKVQIEWIDQPVAWTDAAKAIAQRALESAVELAFDSYHHGFRIFPTNATAEVDNVAAAFAQRGGGRTATCTCACINGWKASLDITFGRFNEDWLIDITANDPNGGASAEVGGGRANSIFAICVLNQLEQ